MCVVLIKSLMTKPIHYKYALDVMKQSKYILQVVLLATFCWYGGYQGIYGVYTDENGYCKHGSKTFLPTPGNRAVWVVYSILMCMLCVLGLQ